MKQLPLLIVSVILASAPTAHADPAAGAVCAQPAQMPMRKTPYLLPPPEHRGWPALAAVMTAEDIFAKAANEAAVVQGELLELTSGHCKALGAYSNLLAGLRAALRKRVENAKSLISNTVEFQYVSREEVPDSYWKLATLFDEKFALGAACAPLPDASPVAAPVLRSDSPFGDAGRRSLSKTAADSSRYNESLVRLRASLDRLRAVGDGFNCREIHEAARELAKANRTGWEQRVESDLAGLAAAYLE